MRQSYKSIGVINKLVFTLAIGVSVFGQSSVASASLWNDPLQTQKALPARPKKMDCSSDKLTKFNVIKAIDLALCRNPDLHAAWANAKASSAELGQAKSAYLPSLDVNGQAVRKVNKGSRNNAAASTEAGGNVQGWVTSYGPELSLSYLLFDLSRYAEVESARQAMLQAGWNYNETMQALVFEVIKRYADMFSASESLEAAKQAEAASKEAFEAAKARLEVGVVTPADTAQAETAYAQNVLAREQTENALNIAKGQLAILLNLPVTQKLELEPLNPEHHAGSRIEQEVGALIQKALKERPDLAGSRAAKQQAAAELRRAKAQHYPSLSLTASSNKYYYNRDDINASRGSTIGLKVSMPIFSGFNDFYGVQAAKNRLEAAEKNVEAQENAVSLDVWSTYHNYQTANRTFTTAKTLLKSATASEELALGRYKAGKGTLIEALDAQARLADARRQWVEARYNLLVTRFDLARALGEADHARP